MTPVELLIWIGIVFVAILLILMLLRPVFILNKDPVTGKVTNDINFGKLFGWTILVTLIIGIILYLWNSYTCTYNPSKSLMSMESMLRGMGVASEK